MARLISSIPAPTGRERVWAAIRELRRFTSRELALKTGLSRGGGLLNEYLTGLEKAGFLRALNARKRYVSNQYELVQDVGVEAPRLDKAGGLLPPSGRNRMWKSMRILGTFTARDLAGVASLAGAPVAVSEAEDYCRWLCRGGYLRGNGKTWTFIPAMNTGPKAPQVLRVKKLYDPNRDAIVCENTAKGRDDE